VNQGLILLLVYTSGYTILIQVYKPYPTVKEKGVPTLFFATIVQLLSFVPPE
jgi:hypothetical protein